MYFIGYDVFYSNDLIDRLSYVGNRLRNVSDIVAVDPVYKDGMHFFDGLDLLTEYSYDLNGNLTMDKNKYITDISYNSLNLPYSVSVSTPTGSVTLPLENKEDLILYDYDASGKKLNASYACSGPNPTMSFYSSIDYCDNYIYENGVLSKVLLPNGYLSIDESNKVGYHYYLKDHQGNIRVVLSQGNAAEQVNHYYPFGALWGLSKNGSFQKYKFGGKELERVAGLDLYDFEARQYDPILGRFTSMDPLCEKYYSVSPYAYCMNNPINFIDPYGMDIYRYDSKSGTFHLQIRNDDTYDKVGNFKWNKKSDEYQLRGSSFLIDNIEKGILYDGINFMNENNVIDIGGNGQASLEGVQNFIVELSELAGREIRGYELSKKGEYNINHVFIGRYLNNKPNEARSVYNLYGIRPDLYNKVNIRTDFHTHPANAPDSERSEPSMQDRSVKAKTQKNYPEIKKFIILTKGFLPIEY